MRTASIMLAAAHVLVTAVLLPYIALAAGFLLLGQAIAAGSPWAFVDTLLSQFLWIVPWGLIGLIVAICFIAALGIGTRLRWLGGACVCVIAAFCLVVIIAVPTAPVGSGELLFLLPCAIAMVFGGWLFLAERRTQRQA